MDEEAKALVVALLDSGETIYVRNWQRESDGKVLVIAMRTDKEDKEDLEKAAKSIKEVRKAVAGPYGQPCPMCDGTGRI